MHSQQPPGVVQNWSTLQCSKQNTEQCGYDHAPVTRGRMRAQFPLPHGQAPHPPQWALFTVGSPRTMSLLSPPCVSAWRNYPLRKHLPPYTPRSSNN